MGQNQYADWFINGMLGWIRWIANNIAGMFQTNNAHTSNGSTMISWFADNWIKLLLFMIVFGLLIDWIIWMVRWRPYWLWFHRKRILLDDDIDLVLSDEELMRRYAPNEYDQVEAQRRPHFKSSNLVKQSGDNIDGLYSDDEYDEDYEIPDIEDPYLGEDPLEAHALHDDIPEIEIDDDDDYMPQPRQPKERLRRSAASEESDEDYEKERNEFDALYFDGYNDRPYGEDEEDDDEDEDDSDDDEPDISFISGDEKRKSRSTEEKNKRSGWLSRLGRRKSDEVDDDPFSVVGDAFDESDDDDNFKSMVAGINNSRKSFFFDADDEDEDDNQNTPVYGIPDVKISKRRARDLEASSELIPPLDEDGKRRMSYSTVTSSVAPRPQPSDLNPDSRRARRQRRERIDD